MKPKFNFGKRIERIRKNMESKGIDVLIGTRLMSVCYVSGAFVPYRAAVYIPQDGEVALYPSIIEAERVKTETWIKDVYGWGPMKGITWMEQITERVKENNLQNSTIGVEMSVSPRLVEGLITHAEYQALAESLPEAEIVDASDVINEVAVIKEPEEIELLKKAAEIADGGMEAALEALDVGVTETAIVGAGEKRMRELGSMWNWPITGGDEIYSGERGAYSKCGCAPPSNKKVQKGEVVCIDLHCTYELYYSDLAYNIVMGKPTPEQQKLVDTYVELVHFMLDTIQPGMKIGELANQVAEKLFNTEYLPHVPPVFGHGLGIVGHEWYPPIASFEPWASMEFRENMVEELYLQLNHPGVGGLRLEIPVLITKRGAERLTETPVEPLIKQV
ncbi:MAG: M24 family metallopeptidase [Candidatus Freyarchaeota archaeon]